VPSYFWKHLDDANFRNSLVTDSISHFVLDVVFVCHAAHYHHLCFRASSVFSSSLSVSMFLHSLVVGGG